MKRKQKCQWIQLLCLLTLNWASGQNLFQQNYDIGSLDEARALCRIGAAQDWLIGGTTRVNGVGSGLLFAVGADGAPLWTAALEADAAPVQINDAEKSLSGSAALVLGTQKELQSGLDFSFWFTIDANPLNSNLNAKGADPGFVLKYICPVADGFLLSGKAFVLGSEHPLLCKVNTAGNLQWSAQIDNLGKGELANLHIDPLTGFIYGAGSIQNPDNGSNDGLMTCFNASGDLIWAKRVGGPEDESFSHVSSVGSDSYLWMGETLAGNAGFRRVWVATASKNGDVKSNAAYALNARDLYLKDLFRQGSKTVLALDAVSAPNNAIAMLVAINDQGDLLWNRQYPNGASNNRNFQMKKSESNEFIIAGVKYANGADVTLLKTDSLGRSQANCCPRDLDLSRVAIPLPVSSFFVPGVDKTLDQRSYTLKLGPLPEAFTSTPCQDIDLDFSLSDSTACPGACIFVSIEKSTPGVNYFLQVNGGVPDQVDPSCVRALEEGLLRVTRTGIGSVCSLSLQKTVQIQQALDQTPNAFTPDGDGVNDTFFPLVNCPLSNSRFEVFNRWGNRVYASENTDAGWDGTFNETKSPCPADLYVWLLRYDMQDGGRSITIEKKGEVTLLR